MENRLDLDTSVLRENQQIRESLTDINNLNLFTDEFNLIMYKRQNEENEIEKEIREQCFVVSNMQNEEDVIKDKMFLLTQRTINKNTQHEIDYGNYYMLLGSIFIGIVISCIVFSIMDKKEGRK